MSWNKWLESLRLPRALDANGPDLQQEQVERFVCSRIMEWNRELSAMCDVHRGLAVCMSPSDGAELSALSVYDNAQWHELLYRGNDWARVDDWPGRAPWLWPVAGRCIASSDTVSPDQNDEDCSWDWNGVVRKMPWHGFARHQEWYSSPPAIMTDGVSSGAHLLSGPSNREIYPFDFLLSTSQELSNDGIEISFKVEASSDNSGPMPFALGLHFSFDFSSWWGDEWLQGLVENIGRFAWKTDRLAQASERLELPANSVRLLDPALKSAIIPASLDESIRLVCPDGDRSLEMSFKSVSASSVGDLVWVTFLDPQRRFFCLEPWIGWPNAINSGQGRVDLRPSEVWECRLGLGVSSPSCRPQPVSSSMSKKI